MKRTATMTGVVLGLVGLALVGIGSTASALSIQFSGSSVVGGATASVGAMLDYTWLTPSQLKITLDNTSATTDSAGNSNSPAITSFGFDTSNPVPLSNFTLQAYSLVPGAGSGALTDITNLWQISTNSKLQGGGATKFDFVPNTKTGILGGLVNPLSADLTGSQLYETKATFVLTFASAPGSIDDTSWKMKFQNFGKGGAGSIEAAGTPYTPPNPPAVPEPATLLLLGFGLMGLAGLSKKIKKS